MPHKVLFCATVDYHFEKFHLPYMKWFKEQGWEVHVAANGELALPYADRKFNVPIERSPFRAGNVKAYRELKEILDTHHYRLVHCHTPVGGLLARLAARQARKQGTHVLYTAHGFHFCKGASPLNWAVFYPIERWLARYTDCLITINREDFQLATIRRFPSERIEHVHGVGVDTDRFRPADEALKRELRERLGFSQEDYLMFYAAEFNKNKNQQLLIRALALLKNEMLQAKLLLAGVGPNLEPCRALAQELGIERMVHFLGYRNDIHEVLPACDVAVASSLREGLPVNIVEAMACGLPIIATKNRGHAQLIKEGSNGFVVNPNDPDVFAEKIMLIYRSRDLRLQMSGINLRECKLYSIPSVRSELTGIYSSYMARNSYESESQYRSAYI